MAMLQVGSELFREIRENDYCYVDKTAFIEEFLSSAVRISLFTRPRRFGKTLMLTMLRDFFDISQDCRALFEGLAISKNRAICDKWMNHYPTVFITFKRTGGQSFEDALEKIRSRMSDVCNSFAFLTDSPSVDETDREALKTLTAKKGDKVLLSDSLKILCRALHAHYGKPVILLIDEYDVPLARAQENGYYREMEEFIRGMLKEAVQAGECLQFAILTGCLRVAKESIFTGIDSVQFFDVSEARFADKFGFTQKEVDDLLAQAGFSKKKDAIKEWYDGYRFGAGTKIYCPWDILHYLCTMKSNPEAKPEAYWADTSGNDILCKIAGYRDAGDIRHKLDTLMRGGCIPARLSDNLTHDSLYENADTIWTLLCFAGYLTKAGPKLLKKCGIKHGAGLTGLAIPNKEVLEIFASAISDWFADTVRDIDRTELFKAFQADDAHGVAEFLCGQMNDTICWYDAREDFYHDFVKGLFSFSSWDAESYKCCRNKPDLVLYDKKDRRCAIIEIRRTRSQRELPGMAEKTLTQIKKKQYAASLLASLLKRNWKVSLWGMAFFKKSCVLRVEEGKLQS